MELKEKEAKCIILVNNLPLDDCHYHTIAAKLNCNFTTVYHMCRILVAKGALKTMESTNKKFYRPTEEGLFYATKLLSPGVEEESKNVLFQKKSNISD